MEDLGAGAGRGTVADAPVDAQDLADAAPLAYDLLTGLVSREVFDGQLARVLERTWRTPTSVAVLVLQVRDLRLISDRFGRLVGDEVLGAAAARLRTCLREVDLVARIDAATFGVILETDRRQARPELMAADVASRLVSLFAEPLSTTLTDLTVHAAIGVAVADHASLHADQLVGRAELAMADRHPARRGVPVLRGGPPGRCRPPPPAQDRPRSRHRARGVLAPLPTARLVADRRHARRRSAAAVGRRRARQRLPQRVHPRRRGDRPHHPDRRVGAPHGARAAGAVGRGAARPAR